MRILFSITILIALTAGPALAVNSDSNFGGVGIDGVPLADGRIKVRQIVQGGPAQQAGVRNGDIITHIDGKPTLGSDFHAMVQKRLRGVSGTPVVLKIVRDGEAKPLTLTLTRRQLVVNPGKEK